MMMDQTFQEKEEAVAKLQRAKLSSVQLVTYFAGWRDHLRMREIAREAQGARFNLAAYHKAVLEAGGLPVAGVAKLITGREFSY